MRSSRVSILAALTTLRASQVGDAAQGLERSAYRVDHRTASRFGQSLGALAAQLLHACPDHRKIDSGTGSGLVYCFLCSQLGSVNRHYTARNAVNICGVRAADWKIDVGAVKLSRRFPRSGTVAMNLAHSDEPDQSSSRQAARSETRMPPRTD
jgi:hypothetical protein